jgi:uncharacterized protein (TIGR03437 family)
MNRLGILFLSASSLFAADFLNGQAARAVIGQPHFTAQLPGPASAIYPGNMLLGSVSGLAWANGVLVVADSSPFRVGADPQNNRVLIYRNLFGPGDPTSTTGPTQLPAATAEPVPNTNSQYWWCPVCGGRADIVVGQTDFNGTGFASGRNRLRTPTAVATDGTRLVIADTDNNRVLIWNSIPNTNGQNADVVLGQPDFTTTTPNTGTANVLIPAANTLRGPEGVWIQGNQLFVADTMNNRALIWNSWPTSNGQPASVVLGQPDFNTQTQGDLTKGTPAASAINMLNPVSITSDGTRLFISDLGQNRVLIWNTIPTQNQAAANVALGQLDLTTNIPDNAFTSDSNGVETPVMCKVSNGKDTNGNLTYPPLCEYTLNLPRYALSDGTRLFVADGGNDRVLIYEPIPSTQAPAPGYPASVVIGQSDFISDHTTDNTNDTQNYTRIASADSIRTPAGLAWDGTNLFVSEAFSRRVLVFTAAASPSLIAPRNAASMEVFAAALITLSSTPRAGDVVTVTVTDASGTATSYTYTAVTGDTLGTVSTGIAAAVNAGSGDANVLATAVPVNGSVRIQARVAGPDGNNLQLSASAASGDLIGATATAITGGTDASHVAPGTLVAIFGQNLTDGDTLSSTNDGIHALPTRLGTAPKSVEAFANGIAMPLLYVSPTQINAQIPFEIAPATSISVYVRTTYGNGTVAIANAAALPVAEGVPGFFASSVDPVTHQNIPDPRPAIAVHYSSSAMGVIDLELTAAAPVAGDTVSITIGSATYTYTILSTDTTLDNVRDALINLINKAPDPTVTAYPGGQWDRLILIGNTPGTSANGVVYSGANTGSGSVTSNPLTSKLCCASTRGALVTVDKPAQPGEIVTLYGTGFGLIQPTPSGGFVTGLPYSGVFPNKAADFLQNFVSGTFGGSTADVLNAAMLPGTVGVYEVDLLLSSGLTTNQFAQGTVAQVLFITNIVTIPVAVLQ